MYYDILCANYIKMIKFCMDTINNSLLNMLNYNTYDSLYRLYGRYRGKIQHYIPYYKYSINRITENIYIGDIHSASSLKVLKDLDIKNVICAIKGMEPMFPNDLNYINLELIDTELQQINDVFDDTNKFIEKCISNNEKILVHCVCGVSRSVSIVIAYLIYKEKFTYEQALNLIKIKRNVAQPNKFFETQLKRYYDEINL